MAKDPQKIATKWKGRMASSQQDYVDGINRQDVSPMEKAARNKEAMRARTLEAIDSGRWEAGLRKKSLTQWKDDAVKKGARRLSEGAAQAEPKILDYHRQMAGEYERIKREIDGMPNVTPEDRKARMVRNFELMSQLKGKYKPTG